MADENNQVRNIALVGHSGCGKTSLAEALLFTSNSTTRLGKVDDGSSIMDFEPEEIQRKVTLTTAFHPYSWKENNFNIIDTPGENDFLSDTKTCLKTAEGAGLVIDAVDGVKVGTEKVWGFAHGFNLAKIIFINKLDRERADFYKVLDEIKNVLGVHATPIYLPIGKENDFSGLVDLINLKAYNFKKDGSGSFEEGDVPDTMKEKVDKWRKKMIENIVEADDKMMEKYLEGKELTPEEIEKTLTEGIKSGSVTPVTLGSSTLNIGAVQMLDLISRSMPYLEELGKIKGRKPDGEEEIKFEAIEDAPFRAIVFKTIADPFTGKLSLFKVVSGKINAESNIYNSNKKVSEKLGHLLQIKGKKQTPISTAQVGDIVAVAKLKETKTGDTFCEENSPIILDTVKPFSPTIYFAIEVGSKEKEDKVFSSLAKLTEEDPTLKVKNDKSTLETVLSGTGQIHLESTKDKLKRKFGVEINLKTPKIPYRETIKEERKKVEYKHKKQSGGRGQFAVVYFDIFPLKRGEGYIFDEALSGTNVPRNFVPAVEKGINEAMQKGVIAGYPVVDIKIRFFDGKSHDVDSSEMAFKIAAAHCFTQAMREAKPILLEPIMNMEISVPDDAMGDVMGDLNGRRGKVLNTENVGKYQVIKAEAPLAEVLKYTFDLTSITSGRGNFQMEQVRYEEVPAHLAEKVIVAAKQEKEEK